MKQDSHRQAVSSWGSFKRLKGLTSEQPVTRDQINREITHDNNWKQDATTLCVITPAAIGPQYFREAAKVIDAAADGSPDRVKTAEIMRHHGLTPAPPPSSPD